MEIRGFTIKFSKIKAKRRRKEEHILQNKANRLLEQTENNHSDKKLLNELYATNLRLRALMRQKTKGAILRSRARWQEQGEHNTKYFLNLEKRNHCRKSITKLKINDNEYTSNQFEILREEKKFYETLYQSRKSETHTQSNSTFFETENVISLNEEEKLSCEGIISENECLRALKEFKNCKSPGTDGLSAEFYKFFWSDISTDIIGSFKYAFKTGMLSISQRRGIISLIPKKNKDKSLLENLRPISLLNIDYKILTKSIAKRLEKVLPKIINLNQTGYIKGRFIGENVRLIQDAMFHTKKEEKPGIAIFLDFRKAFDTVEWDYLRAALQRFNFGPDILNWFDVIYNNASSCVLHNGHASDFFLLERGVRQGCPLSGLLFVIGIELLSGALQKDPSIRGIQVGQKEIKITQYADDTTVLVRDLYSVSQLLKLLNSFKNISGLEVNKQKTEAMWLGSWRNSTEKPFGFKWPQNSIYALGVHFAYDPVLANKLNFEEKVYNLEQTLHSWKRRKLTLIGKINIVKTLGLAKLVYSTSLLTIPKPLIDSINKIIFSFIWEGKTPKIKKKTIIAERKHGGLKMIDFEIMERALKIAWIKRITEGGDASWKTILNYAVRQFGGVDFLINCDYDVNSLNLEQLPEFYRTLLCYWQEFKLSTDSKEIPVYDQIIWNNRNIRLDGKTIFITEWYKKGIIYIHDLLNADFNFLSLTEFNKKFSVQCPFTIYYGLINAIPKTWKSSLRNIAAPANRLTPGAPTPTQLFSTKSAYSKLLEKRYLPPTAEPKILNHGFTTEDIHNVYLLPFRILKEAKLIMFQLKIIHGILPTQASLFRAGLSDLDKCPLCNLESQSLPHLLITCPESMTFWDLFTRWWQTSFHQHIALSEKVILYGWLQTRNSINSVALNYSLIIAKYHIFASSISVGSLDFDSFLLRLEDKLCILRTLAIKNKKLDQFKETWAALL